MPATDRTDVAVAFGCAAVALVNYGATLCPTVGPGDSGELTIAALRLGICHPPGYPLFTWLGRIACLIPAGEPALLTNALTATFASAAIAFLYLAARAAGLSRLGSVVSALVLAFSATFWTSATSHEVYGLALLLLVLTFFVVLKADPEHPRRTLLAAFLYGLAVSHHNELCVGAPGLDFAHGAITLEPFDAFLFFDGFFDVLSVYEFCVILLGVEICFAGDVCNFGKLGGKFHLVICESAAVLYNFG